MKKLNVFLSVLLALVVFQGCGGKQYQPPKEGDSLTSQQIVDMLRLGWPVYLKGCTIKGTLDFTEVSGGSGYVAVAPSYVYSDIVFANCVFEDSVTAFSEHDNAQKLYTVFDKNVVFMECDFKRGVNFTQSDFRGRFDFDISKVAGNAAFDGCKFRGGSSFAMANFNGEASFVSSVFGGRTNFMKSFFRKSVIFQRCRMEDMVMFADSHFYGYTEFSKVTAMCDIDFTNSQFADRLVMARSLYMGNIKFANCVFKSNLEFIGNTLAEQPNVAGAQLPEAGVNAIDNFMLQKAKIDCFNKK